MSMTKDAATASALETIAHIINIPAWLVGGASRDALMGITPRDLDIVVEGGRAEWCAERIANCFNAAPPTALGFPNPRAWQIRIKIDGATYEIEFINAEGSIEEDMWRRDFTCNGIAIPITAFADGMTTGWLDQSRIVDPTGGIKDIRNGTLRLISKWAAIKDPTRIIRCGRLIPTLRFQPDPESMAIMSDPANWERIQQNCTPDSNWTQLKKIFASDSSPEALQFFSDIGIADIVFPGLVAQERAMEAMRWAEICFATTSDGMDASEREAWTQARQLSTPNPSQMFIIRIAALATGLDSPAERLRAMRIPLKIARPALQISGNFAAALSDEPWKIHDAVGTDNAEMACWFAMTQAFARGERPRFERLHAAIGWKEPTLPNGSDIARTCNIQGPQIGEMNRRLREAVRRETIANDRESMLAFAQANTEQVRQHCPAPRNGRQRA